MKIGIDTFGCDHARSGLGTYLFSFAAHLSEASDVQAELFGSQLDRFTYTSGKDILYNPVNVANSLHSERLWHFTSSGKFFVSQKYDAVLFPAPERVLPVSFKTPGVAVVNSILSSQIEGNCDWTQKLQIKRGLYKIQKIIAASHYIASDLVNHGVSADKIEVVYNGIDHKLFFPSIDFADESSIICNRGYGGTVSIIDPFGNGKHIKNKVNYYMDTKRQKEVFDEFIKTNPMILCRTNKQVKAIQEFGYSNVSTVHQAKGLEYDNVIVIDTTIRNMEDLNIAYVALTRARDNMLVINWSNLEQMWLQQKKSSNFG